MLTQLQAWRTIGEAYDTLRSERSAAQRELAGRGICFAHSKLFRRGSIVWTRMRNKIEADLLNSDLHAYFCAYTSDNDKPRSDYCYLQYYMLGGK